MEDPIHLTLHWRHRLTCSLLRMKRFKPYSSLHPSIPWRLLVTESQPELQIVRLPIRLSRYISTSISISLIEETCSKRRSSDGREGVPQVIDKFTNSIHLDVSSYRNIQVESGCWWWWESERRKLMMDGLSQRTHPSNYVTFQTPSHHLTTWFTTKHHK